MTPSQAVRNRGLDSLKQLSELSGIPRKTLNRWHTERPDAFDLLIRGAHDRLLHEASVRLRNLQRAQA